MTVAMWPAKWLCEGYKDGNNIQKTEDLTIEEDKLCLIEKNINQSKQHRIYFGALQTNLR